MTTKAIEAQCSRSSKLAGGGIALGFRIHADDAHAVVHIDPGKRYALAIVEIDDNEQQFAAPSEDGDFQSPTEGKSASGTSRPSKFSLSQKAGRLCNLPSFRMFLEQKRRHAIPSGCRINSPEEAAHVLRAWLDISSRKELDTDPVAAARFEEVLNHYAGFERGL